MDSIVEEYTWVALSEAEAKSIAESRGSSTLTSYNISNESGKNEWINTLQISITWNCESRPRHSQYTGHSIEIGASTNKRVLIPALFNGLAILGSENTGSEHRPTLCDFRVFASLIGLKPIDLITSWEDFFSYLNSSGSGGQDGMKAIAAVDVLGLEKAKQQLVTEFPKIFVGHPQDLVPVKSTDSQGCSTPLCAGLGIWVYTSTSKYYQLIRGEWSNHMVCIAPQNFAVTLPEDCIGIYTKWLPILGQEELSSGCIWGRLYVYESKEP